MGIKKIEKAIQPLAEVFGFPINNYSDEAQKCRSERLCPFQDLIKCTKDKAKDPLGVCTVYGEHIKDHAIICPMRLKQGNKIFADAATFFFPAGANWIPIEEVRLNDKKGKSAGNIDFVLAQYDNDGRIIDFGAIEIQSVYISGNVRTPFSEYMKNPQKWAKTNWSKEEYYPRADYLSSSRKRLVPQLIFKGTILKKWEKKIAVAVHDSFYNTLPRLPRVAREKADVAWMIYKLELDKNKNVFTLNADEIIYTELKPAIKKITTSNAGQIDDFLAYLQRKLKNKISIEK
jgi:hypothetical protein